MKNTIEEGEVDEDNSTETELKQWQNTLATFSLYTAIALTVFHIGSVAVGFLVFDSILFIGGMAVIFFFTVPTMVFAWIGYGLFQLVYHKGPGYVPIRKV